MEQGEAAPISWQIWSSITPHSFCCTVVHGGGDAPGDMLVDPGGALLPLLPPLDFWKYYLTFLQRCYNASKGQHCSCARLPGGRMGQVHNRQADKQADRQFYCLVMHSRPVPSFFSNEAGFYLADSDSRGLECCVVQWDGFNLTLGIPLFCGSHDVWKLCSL